jgi:uncharacterized membrane protein (UPF0182 family)
MILIFSGNIVSFIINIEWFKEVGYLSVYFTKLKAMVIMIIPMFLICFIAIGLYYKSIKKSFIKYKRVIEINRKKDKLENRIFILANFILSLLISYSFSSTYWYKILQFLNSSSFNQKDPIFNLDISFYIFKLPLIESLYELFMGLLVMLVVITVVIYFALYLKDKMINGGSSKLEDIKSGITKFAGKQLAVLSALILLLLSLGYIINGWDLVYSSRGVVFGASFTDVHVSLLFYRIIAVVSLISSIVIFVSILKSKSKPIIISISSIIVLIIIENVTAMAVQNLYVKPNEKALETPYISDNINFTRKAFNIENIDQIQYSDSNTLTENDINANKATIDNIKINSFTPSLEFYNQVQEIRYYYNFNDVDVDRYNINGKLNEVFIAPREINKDSLTGNADTWQNKHLSYTHGYGVVMSKVNSVTSEGQPDFIMKNIPTENSTDIKLTNPRIYFGESNEDYVIVNNNLGEFDYPLNGVDKTFNYNGTAGIQANLFNRILFAINKGDLNFLVSSAINNNSKILINRNIMDRVKAIAPFLTYDSDPYCVINNGRLYWIIDAYTTSDRYPFSEPVNNINYIRNSIKVVVDAYNGNVDFYQVDKNDPIANSYAKIFKGLFKDVSQAPEGIREHFRYPEDLYNIQCQALTKYHVTDPSVFYNGEDLWSISQNQSQIDSQNQNNKQANKASYMVMKLPNASREEMVLLNYFNMKGKNNMVSIFAARMDGNNYGKLVLYRMPTDKTVYSPYLFMQNINQDPTISKEVSLWNTQGSSVQYGDTSIIPIDNSLLYVEPLYLRASGNNSIPEVKEIVLSDGNKIVMGTNMGDALNKLFGNNDFSYSNTSNSSQNQSNSSINSSQINQANDLYNKALDAEKNGDWTNYGNYIKQLGDILKQLSK